MHCSRYQELLGLLLICLALQPSLAGYSAYNELFEPSLGYDPASYSPSSASQTAAGRFLGHHATSMPSFRPEGPRIGLARDCDAQSLPDLNAFVPGIPAAIANQSPAWSRSCSCSKRHRRVDPADIARLTSACAPGMYTPPIHRTPPPRRPIPPCVERPFVMPKIECPVKWRKPHVPRVLPDSSTINPRCLQRRARCAHCLHFGQGRGLGFGFGFGARPACGARNAFLDARQFSQPQRYGSACGCSIDSIRLRDGRQLMLDAHVVEALKETVSKISNAVAEKIQAAKCGGQLDSWSLMPTISHMGCEDTGPSEEELERRRENQEKWDKMRRRQEADRILRGRERYDIYSGTPCVAPPLPRRSFAAGPPGVPCSAPPSRDHQRCQWPPQPSHLLPKPGRQCDCNSQQRMLAMYAAREALMGHREVAERLLAQAQVQGQMACSSDVSPNPFLPDTTSDSQCGHRHRHRHRHVVPQDACGSASCREHYRQPFIDPALKKCYDALYPDSSQEPPSIEPPDCYRGPHPLPTKTGAGSHPSDWTELVRPLNCGCDAEHDGPAIKIAWRYRTPEEASRPDGRSIDGRQGYGYGAIELIVNDNPYDSAYITERQLELVKNHFTDLHYFRLSDHELLQHSQRDPHVGLSLYDRPAPSPADSTSLGPGAIGDISLGFLLTTKRYISLDPPSVVFEGKQDEVTIVSGRHRYTWHCGSMERCYDPILRLPSYNLTISIQAGSSMSAPDFRIFKTSPDMPLTFMGCPLRDFGDGLGLSNEIENLSIDKSLNRVSAVYSKDPHASCAFTVSPSARMLLEHFQALGRLDFQAVGSTGTSPSDWHSMSREAGGHLFRISWRKRSDREILERRTMTLDGRVCLTSSGLGEYEVVANDNPVDCSILTHNQLETLKAIFPVAPYLLNTQPGHPGALGHIKEGFMITLNHVEHVQPMVIVFGGNPAVLPIHFHGHTYELHYGSDQGYVELFHTKSFKLVFPKFSDPYAPAENAPGSGFSIHRRFENGPIEFHACLPHHEILDVTLNSAANIVSGRGRNGQPCQVPLSRASVHLIQTLMAKGFFSMNQITELGMSQFPSLPMPGPSAFPSMPLSPPPSPSTSMSEPSKVSLGGFIKGAAKEAVTLGSNKVLDQINGLSL